MISGKREHVIKTLDAGKRYDGRAFDEYRPIKIETGVIRNAEGSARAMIGDTEVLGGVKMAVESPYPDTPESGNLMVNVELLPLSHPEFEAGPPSEEAVEMARIIDRGIREAHAIDVHALCVTPKEKVWSVLIDVATMNVEGNVIDATALAAVAAVKNAKLPQLEDGVVKYDKMTDKSLPLDMKLMPVTVTVHKIGKHLIVDPSPDEEEVSDARLSIAVVEDGTLVAMQKGGTYPLSADDIDKMVQIAQKKASELRKLIA